MEPEIYLNFLKYIETYNTNKITFELDLRELVHSDILVNNCYKNEISGKSIEFIGKNEVVKYKLDKLDKYRCQIKINFDNKLMPRINFTLEQKSNIYLVNEKIQIEFPNLYNQIIQWWKENIIVKSSFLELEKLREKIIDIKKYISNNFALDILPTKLYQFYYSNIDKFINVDEFINVKKDARIKNLNSQREFYNWMCEKYNLDSTKTNFELDYLQNYLKNKMCLTPDFEVLLPKDQNQDQNQNQDKSLIIKFSNTKVSLEIGFYEKRHRYSGYYEPDYSVHIVDMVTNNVIASPYSYTYDNHLNEELDKYYTNLIEYIKNFCFEIKSFN